MCTIWGHGKNDRCYSYSASQCTYPRPRCHSRAVCIHDGTPEGVPSPDCFYCSKCPWLDFLSPAAPTSKIREIPDANSAIPFAEFCRRTVGGKLKGVLVVEVYTSFAHQCIHFWITISSKVTEVDCRLQVFKLLENYQKIELSIICINYHKKSELCNILNNYVRTRHEN